MCLLSGNDCRSNFGSNIRNICRFNDTYNIHDCIRDSVKYFPINVSDNWRVGFLKELISVNNNNNHLDGLSSEEIKLLLEFVACS